MMWARIEGGTVVDIYPRSMPVKIGDTLHSSQIFTVWTDAERKALGIYPVELPPAPDSAFWIVDGIDYAPNGEQVVGTRRLLPVSLDQAQRHVIRRIKALAGELILNHVPDYAQRNLLAQGVMAVTSYGSDVTLWPEAERARFASAQATWAFVQAVRAESDEREAEVLALTSVAEVAAYDWRSGWPAL
jgi:hypothetical protein